MTKTAKNREQPTLNVGESLCLICDKPYQYRRVFKICKEYPELICCDFNMSHPACQKAYDKVEKLRRELTNAEFELFLINHKY
jgi:hypothetical protein